MLEILELRLGVLVTPTKNYVRDYNDLNLDAEKSLRKYKSKSLFYITSYTTKDILITSHLRQLIHFVRQIVKTRRFGEIGGMLFLNKGHSGCPSALYTSFLYKRKTSLRVLNLRRLIVD